MSMRAAARRVASAIRQGARAHREEIGPGQYRGQVTHWRGEDDFRVDLHGQDLELDEADVTLGQSVRRYHDAVGIEEDDALVLVEVGEGDYIAVDVESAREESG